jgi:hypothetical protein
VRHRVPGRKLGANESAQKRTLNRLKAGLPTQSAIGNRHLKI